MYSGKFGVTAITPFISHTISTLCTVYKPNDIWPHSNNCFLREPLLLFTVVPNLKEMPNIATMNMVAVNIL